MPWLTRSTAVTILVLLAGYTLLLTVTFDLPRASPKLHTRLVVQKAARQESDGSSNGLSDGHKTDAAARYVGKDLGASSEVSTRPESSKSGSASCTDKDVHCEEWRRQGQCLENPGFMLRSCWKACGGCAWQPLSNITTWVNLTNGVRMPRVGFGTAGLGQHTKQATLWALEAGYRMLDSAQAREWYREDLVGAALAESGLPRSDVFLTSKLHPRHHGYESALHQFEQSLGDLRTSYLDLFLLHYPRCWPGLCAAPQGSWQDSWRALEALLQAGKVRAIGVSNFELEDLVELLKVAHVRPAVVQRNSDPFHADLHVQAFCFKAGIQYEAYSSLGSQWLMRGYSSNPVLNNPVIQRIASQRNRHPAQVVLRWGLQHGQVVIPQSSNQLHIASNFNVDFILSPAEVAEIDALDGTNPPRVS